MSIEADASAKEAAELMVAKRIGGLLVVERSKPVGVVTERDILRKVTAEGLSPSTVKVREIMSTPLITIGVNTSLDEAVDLMTRKKVRRLFATEAGEVVGIFTQRDILALNRVCSYCNKAIRPKLVSRPQVEGDLYVECSCGSRYHMGCAKTVVHCVRCSTTIVTDIVYPEPSETTGG